MTANLAIPLPGSEPPARRRQMKRRLPTWLRLRIKHALVMIALAGVDSIVPDDRIAARDRLWAHRQGHWLLRYALRLHALRYRARISP